MLYHPAQVDASSEVMTNQWLVQLSDDLGPDAAKLVAKRNGFSYVSPVSTKLSSAPY
jgi:hypothetical protein